MSILCVHSNDGQWLMVECHTHTHAESVDGETLFSLLSSLLASVWQDIVHRMKWRIHEYKGCSRGCRTKCGVCSSVITQGTSESNSWSVIRESKAIASGDALWVKIPLGCVTFTCMLTLTCIILLLVFHPLAIQMSWWINVKRPNMTSNRLFIWLVPRSHPMDKFHVNLQPLEGKEGRKKYKVSKGQWPVYWCAYSWLPMACLVIQWLS